MGAVHIVVYAEGGGELKGAEGPAHEPGAWLDPSEHGPAHVLVRRILEARGVPGGAVHFEEPLRTWRGRLARGSMLHDGRTLRKLLSWPVAGTRPDLAVVLVDADEELDRKKRIDEVVADLPVSKVVGVAVREFEAWLIGDSGAVREVAGMVPSARGRAEEMAPGEAKLLLRSLTDRVVGADGRSLRTALAAKLDLDLVCGGSASFSEFRTELSQLEFA